MGDGHVEQHRARRLLRVMASWLHRERVFLSIDAINAPWMFLNIDALSNIVSTLE